MTGTSTTITDPAAGADSATKSFTFDYSYWSHDGFTEKEDGYLAAASTEYADQVIRYFLIRISYPFSQCRIYICHTAILQAVAGHTPVKKIGVTYPITS